MFETVILVLLYNKEITESNTINTLLESNIQYSNARLVIWNNGPEPLKNRDCSHIEALGYDLVIEETLHNESLAVIYNKFLAENRAEKYILLDDDSVLNTPYILASSKCGINEVAMPIISSEGKVQSPQINDQPYSPKIELTSNSKVITIGSGLVIGADIAANLKENYKNVFDERFYLYGVDTTFCLRLFNSNLTKKIKIIFGFEHSLSRLEKESQKTIKFRRLERSYDLGLTLRYYYPLPNALLVVLKVTISTLKRKFFKQQYMVDLFPLFKAFVLGKHYRAEKEKNAPTEISAS